MKKNLEELTIKQLTARLIKAGTPKEEAELFKTKDQLIVMIDMKAKEKVSSLKDTESPSERRESKNKYTTKVDIMREKLNNQSKIRIKLPLEGKEQMGVVKRVCELSKETLKNMNLTMSEKNKFDTVHISGAVEPVTLNGYKTFVPKGIYFEVPEQVADALDEADRNTAKAGEAFLFDRFDEKTGRTVKEAMT